MNAELKAREAELKAKEEALEVQRKALNEEKELLLKRLWRRDNEKHKSVESRLVMKLADFRLYGKPKGYEIEKGMCI